MLHIPKINFWFTVIIFIIGCLLVWLLPQRLPKVVSALIMILSLAAALAADHTIGVPPFDLYDTNVKPWLTFTEIPTWGLYPICGYFFVYFYDRLNIRGFGIPFYVLSCSLFATGFEYICDIFKVYTYKGWSLRYSFLVYIFMQLMTVIVFKILIKKAKGMV